MPEMQQTLLGLWTSTVCVQLNGPMERVEYRNCRRERTFVVMLICCVPLVMNKLCFWWCSVFLLLVNEVASDLVCSEPPLAGFGTNSLDAATYRCS
jgi:hypothetical protein